MNLIQCDEPCRHQKDGYCALEEAGRISTKGKDCCYFEELRAGEKSAADFK